MTKFEFLIECGKRLIDPGIAMENDKIVHYLKIRQDELLKKTLDNDF